MSTNNTEFGNGMAAAFGTTAIAGLLIWLASLFGSAYRSEAIEVSCADHGRYKLATDKWIKCEVTKEKP
jgi:hypothetical protein